MNGARNIVVRLVPWALTAFCAAAGGCRTDGTAAARAAEDPPAALAQAVPDAAGGVAAQPADAPQAVAAASLIPGRCARCHTTARIEHNRGRDRAWWTATIAKMIGNGARLDPDEQQALIDYLSAPVAP